jgi:hypothetical protein
LAFIEDPELSSDARLAAGFLMSDTGMMFKASFCPPHRNRRRGHERIRRGI